MCSVWLCVWKLKFERVQKGLLMQKTETQWKESNEYLWKPPNFRFACRLCCFPLIMLPHMETGSWIKSFHINLELKCHLLIFCFEQRCFIEFCIFFVMQSEPWNEFDAKNRGELKCCSFFLLFSWLFRDATDKGRTYWMSHFYYLISKKIEPNANLEQNSIWSYGCLSGESPSRKCGFFNVASNFFSIFFFLRLPSYPVTTDITGSKTIKGESSCCGMCKFVCDLLMWNHWASFTRQQNKFMLKFTCEIYVFWYSWKRLSTVRRSCVNKEDT